MPNSDLPEKRGVDLSAGTVQVESYGSPRDASDELIYLVQKLFPYIEKITGIEEIYGNKQLDDEVSNEQGTTTRKLNSGNKSSNS